MPRNIDVDSQIGRQLRLRDLHLFFTVVQCGSMAKAASYLGISQPAVSEVIANLEHTLGVRLFDRSPHGVEPTMYGHALLKRSRAAFDELKQGIRDIEFLADPTAGEVRIGCSEVFSATIVPHVVQQFSQAYPRVVVHVNNVPPPTREQSALRDRNNDLILGRWVRQLPHNPLGDDLNVEILFDDPLVIAAGMDSRWARRRKINLAELIDEPWILGPANTANYVDIAEGFRAFGLAVPKVSIVTVSVPLRAHMLGDGRHITAFHHSALRFNAVRYALKVLPVDLPVAPRPVVIVTLKNRTLSPVVERFIECTRKVARSFAAPARS